MDHRCSRHLGKPIYWTDVEAERYGVAKPQPLPAPAAAASTISHQTEPNKDYRECPVCYNEYALHDVVRKEWRRATALTH